MREKELNYRAIARHLGMGARSNQEGIEGASGSRSPSESAKTIDRVGGEELMATKVDKDACVGCGTCAEECPSGAITIKDEKAEVDENTCVDCGSCAEICPSDAIKVEEKKEQK